MTRDGFVVRRSLGGGRLPAGQIVRHVYLDEAGISDNGKEPFLVVAAAITNPDWHWHEIVNYYNDLAQQWIEDYEPALHGNFVFHAMDVWHGTGAFPRSEFSLQDRMKIFKQLCQAPDLLGIPLCVAVLEKDKVDLSGSSKKSQDIFRHSLAFAAVMQHVDDWMEEFCKGQVAMVTAEDTDLVKEALKLFHSSFQGDGRGYAHETRETFVSRSLVDSINFAAKHTSPIMQMADHLAFTVRRAQNNCKYSMPYLDQLKLANYESKKRPRSLSIRYNIGAG